MLLVPVYLHVGFKTWMSLKNAQQRAQMQSGKVPSEVVSSMRIVYPEIFETLKGITPHTTWMTGRKFTSFQRWKDMYKSLPEGVNNTWYILCVSSVKDSSEWIRKEESELGTDVCLLWMRSHWGREWNSRSTGIDIGESTKGVGSSRGRQATLVVTSRVEDIKGFDNCNKNMEHWQKTVREKHFMYVISFNPSNLLVTTEEAKA